MFPIIPMSVGVRADTREDRADRGKQGVTLFRVVSAGAESLQPFTDRRKDVAAHCLQFLELPVPRRLQLIIVQLRASLLDCGMTTCMSKR